MSYLRNLCLFCLSLPPVVCRRAHVLFTLFVFVLFVLRHEPSYKQLEVKTNRTNTNYVNKTGALLQTTGGKDKQNKHK
jgi:hypothetical protein